MASRSLVVQHTCLTTSSSTTEQLCLKVRIPAYYYDTFSLMPQRGNGLQPRVAASATLGTGKEGNFNRNAVASFSQREMHKADATALRLNKFSLPRVAEAATLGWRP